MVSVEAPVSAGERKRPSILELAGPSIAANLLFSCVAMVQTKFVGGLGAPSVAAVGVGQRVFFALQAVLMAIGIGSAALVARAWGAGDRDEASRALRASFALAVGVGAILALIGTTCSHAIASAFGLDEHTTTLAARNVFWLSAFIIGFAIDIILSSALRAAGNAWTPLIFGAAVNALNVPLLYIFIFGKFGIPAMGPAGAPFASGLSLTLCGAVLVILWMRQKLTIKFLPRDDRPRERRRKLMRIAYPAALEQLVSQTGLLGFLILIGHFYGADAFAAYGVGVNMLNAAMVVGFGFAIAGSTLVGQNLGAGDPQAAARAGWRACGLGVLAMTIIGLVVVLNARPLANFFLESGGTVVDYTTEFTYIMAAMLPLLGVENGIGGSLRGAGDTRFPLLTSSLGLVVMRCGLAAIFCLLHMPVVWVYSAIIGDYLLRGSLLIWRFKSGRWMHVLGRPGHA